MFPSPVSNNRVLRQYGLVYVICEIWILGKSYVYVYVRLRVPNTAEVTLSCTMYLGAGGGHVRGGEVAGEQGERAGLRHEGD